MTPAPSVRRAPAPLAIALVAWRRPAYLRACLDALRRCDGVGDALVLPHVDPAPDPAVADEVRALVEGIDFAESRPTFHRGRLGEGANHKAALVHGLARARFALLLEEDVVLAPDALGYFAWARDRYRDDDAVFSATAYHHKAGPEAASEPHRVGRRAGFHGLATATWPDRLAACDGPWRHWDTTIQREVFGGGRAGVVEVYPALGRADHIGLETSIHDPAIFTPDWFAEHHSSRCWAGSHGVVVPPGEWHE